MSDIFLIISPLFTLFRSCHHNHKRRYTFRHSSSFSLKISSNTIFESEHRRIFSLTCSSKDTLHNALTLLHLRKICPPSSSNLKHMGHLVSTEIPFLLSFVRTGRLFGASLHRKCNTLFGRGSAQSFFHLKSDISPSALEDDVSPEDDSLAALSIAPYMQI